MYPCTVKRRHANGLSPSGAIFCSYVESCIETGVLRREHLTLSSGYPGTSSEPLPGSMGLKGKNWIATSSCVMLKSTKAFVVSREEPPERLAEQLSKAATMRQGELSAEARVETLLSCRESFVHNPQLI